MPEMMKRSKVLLAAAAFGTVALSGALPATAQEKWPNRPIRLIVPFPPGGSADIHARPLAEELRRRLGHPVVVDNRAGAAGTLAGAIVARSSPDGHTLIVDPGSVIIMAPLVQATPWTSDDFTPVAQLSRGPFAIVVHPDVPARNLDELLRRARERPGEINYGSAGPGSATHLVSEALWLRTKVRMVHVPYKGGGPLVVALAGGEVRVGTPTLPSAIGMIRDKRLRLLAYTSEGAPPGSPEAPTLRAAGVDLDMVQWHGIFGPKGLPKDLVSRISAEIIAAVESPDVSRVYLAAGATPAPTTADAFSKVLRSETAHWREVVRAANIRAD